MYTISSTMRCTHDRTHIYTHATTRTDGRTHARTHIHTHTRRRACARARARAHARTRNYGEKQNVLVILILILRRWQLQVLPLRMPFSRICRGNQTNDVYRFCLDRSNSVPLISEGRTKNLTVYSIYTPRSLN